MSVGAQPWHSLNIPPILSIDSILGLAWLFTTILTGMDDDPMTFAYNESNYGCSASSRTELQALIDNLKIPL